MSCDGHTLLSTTLATAALINGTASPNSKGVYERSGNDKMVKREVNHLHITNYK